jgi:hypothetical protein
MKTPRNNRQEMRKIMFNMPQEFSFCDNSIKTAKYNKINFIPLAIIYQFTNYFNVYFLFAALLQSITIISPVNPGVALVPFLFVMVISVIREGLEDSVRIK